MILNKKMKNKIYKIIAIRMKEHYSTFMLDLKSRFEQVNACSNIISQGGDFQKLTIVR